MALNPLIAKLTVLKYPSIGQLKKENELSFLTFGKIVQHLENQYIRQLDDSERRQLTPITNDGDVKQYANTIESYLGKDELAAPSIIISLAQRIIPSPTPPPAAVVTELVVADDINGKTKGGKGVVKKQPPTKDAVARLQLATFLVSKSIEFDHQEFIVEREKEQKENDGKGKTGKDSGAGNMVNLPLLPPQQLSAQPSGGATLNNAGFIKMFGDVVPKQFDLEKFKSTCDGEGFQKDEKTFLVNKLSQKCPKFTPAEEQLVIKEVDRLTQTMIKMGSGNKAVAKSLDLFATLPVGVGNIPKSLFDINITDEDNMTLWEYVTYVATVYSYVTRLTDKISVHFSLPRALHYIALVITGLQQGIYPSPTPQPTTAENKEQNGEMKDGEDEIKKEGDATEKNNKNTKNTKNNNNKSPKPTSTSPPSLTQITESTNQLWILAKATQMILLSVFGEFSRRIECEITSTTLALKFFQPITKSPLSPPLLSFLHEITPEGFVTTKGKEVEAEAGQNQGKKGQDGQNQAQNGQNGAFDGELLMPSHIFPSVNANPNALKKAAKEFESQKKAATVAGKKGKGDKKDNTGTNNDTTQTPGTTTTTTPSPTSATALTGANMPVANTVKADLTKIRQQRLKNETFAGRNTQITNYINGRYHLSRLVSISTLSSQEALYKLSTLATLPLGTEATKRQQEQLAAFGKANVAKLGSNGSEASAPKVSTEMNDGDNGKAEDGKEKKEVKTEKKHGTVSSQHFIAIITTLVHLLYDQQLQQQQNIITRWIQYLQTFTARTSHQGSK
jgi:hypothetical protein